MFANTLTLKKQDGTDVDFVLTKYDGQGGSSRLSSGSTLTDPTTMAINHRQVSPKGSAVVIDQHLIKFEDTLVDSATNRSVKSVVNLTLNIPRDGLFTKTSLHDQLRQLIQLLTGSTTVTVSTTVIDQLLRGES